MVDISDVHLLGLSGATFDSQLEVRVGHFYPPNVCHQATFFPFDKPMDRE